jgi:hypothetical protein
MSGHLSSKEIKALRESHSQLSYEGSFTLQCPVVDDWMARRLKRNKHKHNADKAWSSAQFKTLNLARPLLALWKSLQDDPRVTLVEDTLKLWGVSFHELTKQRRYSLLRLTDSLYTPLLADPASFADGEEEKLFGKHFMNALIRETDEDNKLNRSSYYRKKHSGSGYNHCGDGHRKSSGSKYNSSNSYYSKKSGPSPKSRYTQSVIAIGARLLHFADRWSLVTEDPWILRSVKEGVRLNFSSPI